MDQRLYNEIESYIMEVITQNASIPNYKLPSERMLSLKFDVSREPIRHAYGNLIKKGVVVKNHGRGYFIRSEANVHSLSSKENVKVSLIISDITTRYTHDILSGINAFCWQHNMELSILVSDSDPEKENNLLKSARQSGVKGIILFPVNYDTSYNDALFSLTAKKFPLVLIDRTLPVRASYIASENHQAMIDAVEYLYRKGIQNPVYLSPPIAVCSTTETRLNGFTHGMLRYYKKIEPQNVLIINGSPTEIKDVVIRYLKKYTDVEVMIVLGTTYPAVLMATDELGIRIPQDLKLMIFDDELSYNEYISLKPYLIKQDGYHIGYNAAQALYNQLYGDSRPITQMLPVTIIDTSEEKAQ